MGRLQWLRGQIETGILQFLELYVSHWQRNGVSSTEPLVVLRIDLALLPVSLLIFMIATTCAEQPHG